MINLKPTEFTILRMKHYEANSKPEMLYLLLEHTHKNKKSNIEYKDQYRVSCFGMAANKINEYYKEKDKITPNLIVQYYNNKTTGNKELVINSSYPPADNTGTKKGNPFAKN